MSDVDVYLTLELAREAISPNLAERERLAQFVKSLATGQVALHSATDVESSFREEGAVLPKAASRVVRDARWPARLGLGGAVCAGVLMGYALRMVQERAPGHEPPSEALRPAVIEFQGNLGGSARNETSMAASPSVALRVPNVGTEPSASLVGRGHKPAATERRQRRNLLERSARAPQGMRSPSTPSSSWRGELAFLQRAELAVRERTGDEALRILEQLEHEIPSAAFREEREALRVMAQCLAGLPRARADALRYVQERPGSAHVGRVLELCKLDDPGTRGAAQGR